MSSSERISELFNSSIKVIQDSGSELIPYINAAAETITQALFNEKKLLVCGNGGSASIAQLFSSNMVNRFEVERPGLPVININSDAAVLTSIANDSQFADVFAKQIRALGQEGDILLAITISGESHNIIHVIDAAHDRNMQVIVLTGCDGGQIADLMREQDIEIRVTSWAYPRIYELHLLIIHCICDLIDHYLLGQ